MQGTYCIVRHGLCGLVRHWALCIHYLLKTVLRKRYYSCDTDGDIKALQRTACHSHAVRKWQNRVSNPGVLTLCPSAVNQKWY